VIERDLIQRYARAFAERCAEQIVPSKVGIAYLTPSLPAMYDINALWVLRPSSFEEAAEEAETLLARYAHRKLVVPDEEVADRLVPDAAPGWQATPLLEMVWEADPGGPSTAEEIPLEELRDFRAAQTRRVHRAPDDVVEQFLRRDDLYRRAGNGRFFVVRDESGAIRTSLNLFRLNGVAEIDDVQTQEEARGRGYARAAVLAAARAARAEGAEIVFLVADEADWPKDLYRRLGFRTVGRRYEVTRA
jgi:GNAT superfamily N-acetyltransferase